MRVPETCEQTKVVRPQSEVKQVRFATALWKRARQSSAAQVRQNPRSSGFRRGPATEEAERSEGTQRGGEAKPRADTLAVPHVVYSLREGQRASSVAGKGTKTAFPKKRSAFLRELGNEFCTVLLKSDEEPAIYGNCGRTRHGKR